MRVIITGGRDFCEAETTDGKPRERGVYMNERRALGFALDFVKPKEIIVNTYEEGASRWARIWAEKRGVSTITAPDFKGAVALKPDYAVCFKIGAKQFREAGIDCYEVRMK